MKKTIISVALLVVLGTMATGCQKENFAEPLTIVGESVTVYTVHYSVNGVLHNETLIGEQAWSEFMQRMLALAEQGYDVVVSRGNVNTRLSSSKEVVTFSTTNKDEALAWCDAMVKEGYTVRIDFDSTTGQYNCIATR